MWLGEFHRISVLQLHRADHHILCLGVCHLTPEVAPQENQSDILLLPPGLPLLPFSESVGGELRGGRGIFILLLETFLSFFSKHNVPCFVLNDGK